jgi:hypothetical protein
VAPENIELLSHSLRMIKVLNCKVVEKKYADNPHTKLRLSFTFSNVSYELPITDPMFIYLHKWNKDLLSKAPAVFVVVSLGILYQKWHSKLVAGIFYV